jgi:hypothetical protein
VKKHFCHIFMGTNPLETLLQLLQRFPCKMQSAERGFRTTRRSLPK